MPSGQFYGMKGCAVLVMQSTYSFANDSGVADPFTRPQASASSKLVRQRLQSHYQATGSALRHTPAPRDLVIGPSRRDRESPYRTVMVDEALRRIRAEAPASFAGVAGANWASLPGSVLVEDMGSARGCVVSAFRAGIVDGGIWGLNPVLRDNIGSIRAIDLPCRPPPYWPTGASEKTGGSFVRSIHRPSVSRIPAIAS